jgi:hypothetical protein
MCFKFWFCTLSGIKNGLLQLMPVAEHFVCHYKKTQVNAMVTNITHCSYSNTTEAHMNVKLITLLPSQFIPATAKLKLGTTVQNISS